MTTALTAETFAQQYAERSGVTVEWLRENGREARPCDCGEDGCEGWQMAHIEDVQRQRFTISPPAEHLPRKCRVFDCNNNAERTPFSRERTMCKRHQESDRIVTVHYQRSGIITDGDVIMVQRTEEWDRDRYDAMFKREAQS